MKKTFLSLLVIMFIVSLAMSKGYGPKEGIQKAEVLGAVSAQTNKPIDPVFNSSAVEFRITLNNLFREHAVLEAIALKSLYEDEDYAEWLELLKDNEMRLGEQVKYVYGETTSEKFMQLWNEHINEYQNYTLAKRNNDMSIMDSSRKNLESNTGDLGRLLDDSGRKITAVAIKDLMLDHIRITLGAVEAVAEDDHSSFADFTKEGYEHAGKLADEIVRGMIEDKPDRFE